MATPYKMKNSVLHKSATHGSPMQGNFTSKVKEVAKKVYEGTVPPVIQDVNKKIYDKVKGGKSKEGSKVVNFSKKDSNYDIEFTKSEPKAEQTKTKTKTNYMLKTPRKDTVKMPVVNNNTRPPKKTSKS